MEKSGHFKRKCSVVSEFKEHKQLSLGVSLKLCLFLWDFRGLSGPGKWSPLLVLVSVNI